MPSSTSNSEFLVPPHPPAPETPAARRPIRSIAVTLIVMVLVLALAEGIARRYFPPSPLQSNNMFELDADVGWRFPPHHTTPSFEWFGKVQNLPYTTNNRGLKGTRDYPVDREPGEIRVMCLGDSTANMTHFDGFPEMLERLLREAVPERKFWVMNAGVNGFSSLNMKFMAKQEIPRFKPDFVTVTVGTDDVLLSSRRDRVDYEVRSFGDFLARTSQRSRLVAVARRNLPEELIHSFSNTPGSTVSHEKVLKLVTRTEPWELHDNFAEVVDLARKYDAFPILTLQPWLFWNYKDFDPGALHQQLTPWTEQIHKVAQEKKVALVDGIALFNRPDRAAFWMVHPRPNDKKWGMTSDPIHLNIAGNELLAVQYAKVILAELQRRDPSLKVNMAPLAEVEARRQQTPQPDPEYVTGVPSKEYYEYVTQLMNEKNADENPRPWLKGS